MATARATPIDNKLQMLRMPRHSREIEISLGVLHVHGDDDVHPHDGGDSFHNNGDGGFLRVVHALRDCGNIYQCVCHCVSFAIKISLDFN